MARTHFYTINRLYEEALQSWTLYGFLKPYISLQNQPAAFWDTITENEDLLLPIARNAKNQTVVLLYILFDNEGQGKRGYNIYRLIEEFTKVAPRCADLPRLITKLQPSLKKLRVLRNNRMAHFCATDEWEKTIGGGISAVDMRQFFSILFNILSECGKTFGRRAIPPPELQKVTRLYADRLMRALKVQLESGSIGERRISIDDWHQMANDEHSE